MIVPFERPCWFEGFFSRANGRWLRWLWLILFFVSGNRLEAVVDVPALPENHLLDQGGLFPPELKKRMEEQLKQCASDLDLHIYVMTAPPPKVMPSRTKEKAQELLRETKKQWLADRVGALVIFDDEAGSVTLGASDEAVKVLPPEALGAILKDPQFQSKRKHLAPERLAGTVTALVDQLSQLRAQTQREERKRMLVKWGSIGGGVALVSGVAFLIWKRRAPAPVKRRRHRAPMQT